MTIMTMPKQLAKLSVAAALLLVAPQATLGQASQDQLANVATQFDNWSLSAPPPDGFGIPLNALAILNVVYPSGPVSLGKSYSADEVKTFPTIAVVPVNFTAFKAPQMFTLMLADANALGNPDKDGNYRHFLENGATFGDAGNDGVMALNTDLRTVITAYAGPGPLPQTGVHRYAWLLFSQPSSFQAPSNLSTPGVPPSHWYVDSYVSSTKLGELVAASFFTVQNGNATFPHNATISHTSTPNNSTKQVQTNSTSSNSAAKTGATTSGVEGPVWTNFVETFKGVVLGLGVAFSGFILVQ